jgi:small-conductance mechanosensitive channel
MLPQKTLNFKYQEWDFMIHSSKRSLISILYLCLLLNYKNTVVFNQQSSQETSKIVYLKVWSWVFSLKYILISNPSMFLYFLFYLFLKYAIRFVVCKRWYTLCRFTNSTRLVYWRLIKFWKVTFCHKLQCKHDTAKQRLNAHFKTVDDLSLKILLIQ